MIFTFEVIVHPLVNLICYCTRSPCLTQLWNTLYFSISVREIQWNGHIHISFTIIIIYPGHYKMHFRLFQENPWNPVWPLQSYESEPKRKFSEIRGLRSTQNLLYFMYKKTHVFFFCFSFTTLFFPNKIPGLWRHC